MVRALRLRSRGGRAGCFGGVISAGWSSAGRWSAGRWSAGVEDLQTERVAGRASCSGGVTSAGWSSAGRWSAGRWSAGVEDLQAERVAGRESCRESELQGERVVLLFCSCFDLLVSAFVFAVIVLCFCLLKGRLR